MLKRFKYTVADKYNVRIFFPAFRQKTIMLQRTNFHSLINQSDHGLYCSTYNAHPPIVTVNIFYFCWYSTWIHFYFLAINMKIIEIE